MRPLTSITVAALLTSVVTAPVSAQQRPSPLDGAWRQLRVEIVTPDSAFVRPVAQGVSVFSGRHFSQIWVNPSPSGVQQASAPTTVEEKAARYDVLGANAGTFEIGDTVITAHFEHAKNPRVVGTTRVFGYRIRGDTLTMTASDPWEKDRTKTVRRTFTYVRVR